MNSPNTTVIKDDLYSIELSADQHILYAPLQGLVLMVNTTYRDLLKKAILGDKKAQEILGTDSDLLASCLGSSSKVKPINNNYLHELFKPTSVTLFLTQACTLRCRYCYASAGGQQSMPWELVEAALRFAVRNAVEAHQASFGLNIHGGDIGADWALFERTVRFAQSLCKESEIKLKISLGSNGIYTQKQVQFLIASVTNMTVSLDGIPEVHDQFRVFPDGRPSSAQVMQTLAALDQANFPYAIRMTVTKEGVDFLPDGIQFIGQHLKAKRVKAEPIFISGRASSYQLKPAEPTRFVEKFLEAQTVAANYGIHLEYSGARLGTITSNFCMAAQPIFGVTPDGNITCCYEMMNQSDQVSKDFIYGRFQPETRDFAINWKQVLHLREKIQQHQSTCIDCFCFRHCAGDCPAKIFQTTRVISGQKPDRCIITQALTRTQLINALNKGIPVDSVESEKPPGQC